MDIETAKKSILNHYIHTLYLQKSNKRAIMRLIEESMKFGYEFGWQYELDQSIKLRETGKS